MRGKTACFTGHRNINETYLIVSKKVKKEALSLFVRGYIYFGVGGALGFDTIAAEVLFRLRDYDGLPIKVILVAPFEGYNFKWSEEEKTKFNTMLPKYNKVVYVCNTPSKEAFLARNRHLVDNSSVCIAYMIDENSGTGYTVKYAKSRKIKVINIA